LAIACWCRSNSFSWRERLVAAATGLFGLPEADPRQLAMLGINPSTAALLLNESIDFRPGDWVAQNAANSAVGRSLIAIAKARASRRSTSFRRPELVPELQAVGGDLVIVDQGGRSTKSGQRSETAASRSALTGSPAKPAQPSPAFSANTGRSSSMLS